MAALNTYPKWKYWLLLVLLVLGVLYAIPNLYGEDPAVQVSVGAGRELPGDMANDLGRVLQDQGIAYKAIKSDDNDVWVRFKTLDAQLKAKDIIKAAMPDDYIVALNLAPATPGWLQAIGADPLKLGLDLRGGVHFLMEIDTDTIFKRRIESFLQDIRTSLREAKLRYQGIDLDGENITLDFNARSIRDEAMTQLKRDMPELTFEKQDDGDSYGIRAHLSQSALQALRNDTVEQTISTLRNRVNELGVAEAVVQRQGLNRVVVELPGVQDTARAKDILGKTATLEFVMRDEDHDVQDALGGRIPPGSKIVRMKDKDTDRPILVKKRTVLTGDSITGAMTGTDSRDGRPVVTVRVGGGGVGLFKKVTRENIGKQMAVIYIESKVDQHLQEGVLVKETKAQEKIISLATIQSALGNQFQISGLSYTEAQNLALLLRAGALPAAISIVEERTVGPSLGEENIKQGMLSIQVGLALVLVFMALYYSTMGIIANIALLVNMVLLVALFAAVGATLTLPGIAGIILTVGMAVDASVLIFERIREELRNGMSVQASIHSGFDRAFATIIDANLTTLIAAIILFSVGTGPVRGFAVTLSLGILTSMITAIAGTRAMVNLYYGRRPHVKLRIGI